MSEGTFKYFVGSNWKTVQLLANFKNVMEEFDLSLKKTTAELGVDHLYGSQNGTPFGVLVLRNESESRAPEKEFYRPYKLQPSMRHGDARFWVYVPMRNTVQGKAIAKTLESAGVNKTFSQFAIDALDVDTMQVYGNKAFKTVAGMVDDYLVVSIPLDETGKHNKEPSAEWDMTEVSKSAFIAITEEGNSLEDIKATKKPSM